ncbi:methylenetetrahydrofolate dehydrogenase/methenyltetrahydrofolate cyclohydrolase [mine drainage metagenome]|uniref:Methylenetetrahydrofolate dehydrogenase/methenyltetrahydrofolate cyclohydrolase n=1 Tax=mine drainage metagenome TaxID=410659 RepID=T1C0L2_9ZZZZ
MSASLIDGKAIAQEIEASVRDRIEWHRAQGTRAPSLAVIRIGDDAPSGIYVENKRRACQRVGIDVALHALPEDTTEAALISLIRDLNQDEGIDGILLQLPLPAPLQETPFIETISPSKDVDGAHPMNLGRLAARMPGLRPCTSRGIIHLLTRIGEPFYGRHAVVVGASNLVGRPMALELLLAGATVTICHRFTQNLESHVRDADILVVAVGRPRLIPGDWVAPGATVIDVGINREKDRLVGDVDFERAKERAAFITPVPGGVGPMTVAMLLDNTLEASLTRSGQQTTY